MNTEEAIAFKMPFGRYKGKSMSEIAQQDPKYLDWLVGLKDLKDPVKTAVVLACEHFEDLIDESLGDD